MWGGVHPIPDDGAARGFFNRGRGPLLSRPDQTAARIIPERGGLHPIRQTTAQRRARHWRGPGVGSACGLQEGRRCETDRHRADRRGAEDKDVGDEKDHQRHRRRRQAKKGTPAAGVE